MSNVSYWNDDDRRGHSVMKYEAEPVDNFDLGVALKSLWKDMNERLYISESDGCDCDDCCEYECKECDCEEGHCTCEYNYGVDYGHDHFFDVDYCKHMSRSASHDSFGSFRTQSADESTTSHDQSSDEEVVVSELKEPQRYAYI